MRLVVTIVIITGLDQWLLARQMFKQGMVAKSKC